MKVSNIPIKLSVRCSGMELNDLAAHQNLMVILTRKFILLLKQKLSSNTNQLTLYLKHIVFCIMLDLFLSLYVESQLMLNADQIIWKGNDI